MKTPSDRAKEFGCKSLSQVSLESGVQVQTLRNWCTTRQFVFDAICEKVAKQNPVATQPEPLPEQQL